MLAYRMRRGEGLDGLSTAPIDHRPLAPAEVRVHIHAVALNYRDLLVARGLMGAGEYVVPCSDGAGEVVEIGADVSRFQVGDRVVPLFFPNWIDGEPAGSSIATSLGGNTDGVLAEEIIARESSLVALPARLSWAEGATLPCAGLTAWNALFNTACARAGQVVVIQGTGGVSLWALQLAKAAGLTTVILSSSDAKLERARSLGADVTINYGSTPQWDVEVLRLVGGADIVLDMAGADTVSRSIEAVRPGGTVVTVGGVSGGFALRIDPFSLVGGKRLMGVMVGCRRSAEAFHRFVENARIEPVIDREYAFSDAALAYRDLENRSRFGQVVVRVDR